jgi:hypothetical protein
MHVERAERNVRKLLFQPAEIVQDRDRAVSELLTDLPTAEQELGWLKTTWAQARLRHFAADGPKSTEPNDRPSMGKVNPTARRSKPPVQ